VARVRTAQTILTFITVALAICLCALGPALAWEDKLPTGEGSYEDFVELFQEFAEWRQAQRADLAVPDYSQSAIDRRIEQIKDFQYRIADMSVVDWNRSQRAEYLAALALLDEQEFLLRVYRPWSRDPGFYVDQMQRVSFTELPVSGEIAANQRTDRERQGEPARCAVRFRRSGAAQSDQLGRRQSRAPLP